MSLFVLLWNCFCENSFAIMETEPPLIWIETL